MAAGLLVLGAYLLIAANLPRARRVGADGSSRSPRAAPRRQRGLDALGRSCRLPGRELRFVRRRGDGSPARRLGEDAACSTAGEEPAAPDRSSWSSGNGVSRLPGAGSEVAGCQHRGCASARPGSRATRASCAWSCGWAGLGAFLVLVLGAIVAATVRLSLHARADEIRSAGRRRRFRLPFYLGALGRAGGARRARFSRLYALGFPLFGGARL
jgi:hypothetical protein